MQSKNTQSSRRRFALVMLLMNLATFAAQPAAGAAPAPARRTPSTARDVLADVLAFNRRTLVDAYKQVGRKNPAWDEAAIKFLDTTAAYFSRGYRLATFLPDEPVTAERSRALAMGAAAIKAGCDDPMVLYCYGVFLTDTGDPAAALPLLLKADEGLQPSGYPLWRKYALAKRLGMIHPDKAKAARSAALASGMRVRLMCGKLEDIARRMMLTMLWKDMEAEGVPGAREELVEALDRVPDADPWLRDVFAGHVHISLAWQSRGSGFADSVTDQQWAGFFKHLKIARLRLTRAWKLAPHLPEAAEAMISVAMGAGDQLGEKEFDWFERALDAQVDLASVYDRMYQALLPRWGGSHEQILEVGMACVQTGRYDTTVPWQLIVALRKIKEDAQSEWSEVLADEAVYAKVVEVLEAYAKAHDGTKHVARFKTSHAAVAWQAGKLEEARQVLEGLGKSAEPSVFTEWGAKDGALTIAQVYARTGPHADALAEAARQLDAGDAAGAAATLAAVNVPADDPSSHYVAALARLADWRITFETGEWLVIQPRHTLAGWKSVLGRWTLSDDGALVGNSEGAGLRWMLLVWTGADLGGAPFELAGTFEFPIEPGPGKEAGNGGPAVLSDATGHRALMFFDRDDQTAHFRHEQEVRFGRVEVGRSNEFLMRRDADGTVTVQLNGKPVIGPLTFPAPNLVEPFRFGVGGSVRAGVPVRYTKLRIRKLLAPEDAKAPEPPAPDAAVPF